MNEIDDIPERLVNEVVTWVQAHIPPSSPEQAPAPTGNPQQDMRNNIEAWQNAATTAHHIIHPIPAQPWDTQTVSSAGSAIRDSTPVGRGLKADWVVSNIPETIPEEYH